MKYNFERAIDPHENEKSVDVPERIKNEFISEDPESPLSKILNRFEKASVSEEDIERYRQAARSFAEDRPSKIGKDFSVEFTPQDKYFAPRISFGNQWTETQPLVSGAGEKSLKPRLSKEGNIEEISISGDDALKNFEASFVGDGNRSQETTSQETFETEMNRFMYFVHEPLHIWQALGSGDRFNRLKDKVGADVITPEKEKTYIEHATTIRETREEFGDFSILEKTPFNDIRGGKDGNDHERFKSVAESFVVSNNEATMDFLADETSRELLLENPAVLFNLHNSMVVMVEALRKIKTDAYAKFSEKDIGAVVEKEKGNLEHTESELSLEELRGRYEEIQRHLGFISRMYFAAFDTSDDAKSYFENQDAKVLGKKVGGKLLTAEAFDPFEVEGLSTDVKRLVEMMISTLGDPENQDKIKDALKIYQYPSGETHFKRVNIEVQAAGGLMINFNYPPSITKEGAELAAQVFVEASKHDIPGVDIKKVLKKIDSIPDDGTKVEEVRKNIKDAVGLDLTEDNIREMYGVSDMLFIRDLGDKYPKQYYLRKEIMRRLETEKPELVDKLIQSCFFELEMSDDEFLSLSGFGYKGDGLRWKKEPWNYLEDLIKNKREEIKSFGIFGLDLSELNNKEISKIKELWERKSDTQEEKIQILKELADIKRNHQ